MIDLEGNLGKIGEKIKKRGLLGELDVGGRRRGRESSTTGKKQNHNQGGSSLGRACSP